MNNKDNPGSSRGIGPGGGFGQGGYGSYGTQGGGRQAGGGHAGTWGNETPGERQTHPGGRGPSKLSPDELEASRMDNEGGGSRPGEERDGQRNRAQPGERDRDQPPRGRWQREAITASAIMTAKIKAVTGNSTLQEIAAIMKAENCGVVPVIDDNHKLVGIVTDRDIVVRACADAKSVTETRARDIMTDDVEAVTPDEDIADVIDLMGRSQVRRIPVVDKDDRLLGIISMADIANRADCDEDLQEALERVSARRSSWSRLWT
jgi:CBS domain-containing protein